MTEFLIAAAVLIGGYFVYGALMERIFGIRPKNITPAYSKADGVDYIALPTWKVFLIQFLNIAGLGPIFGAIMGVMFGPAAFLWIVFGTIFAGAVHDYFSGMISLRSGGASLPEVVGRELGNGVKQVMRFWSVILLILVGAVFVVSPAGLLDGMTPAALDKTFWIAAIFGYYILATLLPIDKLIGNLYPIFGLALLFMAAGLFAILVFGGHDIPTGFADGLTSRQSDGAHPIFPMMFVSIACGAISGFHATQSPMMARCLGNEKHARIVFYGAMVTEGVVALIWAAAAIAFTGGYSSLEATLAGSSPAVLVNNLSSSWLGAFGGILAILGVIAAPITSGDTALRSARLIAADFMGVEQKNIVKRLAVSIPIFVLCFVIMLLPYEVLWRYFAWCNQELSVFTLWALTVYLAARKKMYIVTLLPALFMTCVTTTYIFFAPEGFSAITTGLWEVPIPYELAVCIGVAVSGVFLAIFTMWLRSYEAKPELA